MVGNEVPSHTAHCRCNSRAVVRAGAVISVAKKDAGAGRTSARKFFDFSPHISYRRCPGATDSAGDSALGERENLWRDPSRAAAGAA